MQKVDKTFFAGQVTCTNHHENRFRRHQFLQFLCPNSIAIVDEFVDVALFFPFRFIAFALLLHYCLIYAIKVLFFVGICQFDARLLGAVEFVQGASERFGLLFDGFAVENVQLKLCGFKAAKFFAELRGFALNGKVDLLHRVEAWKTFHEHNQGKLC